MKSKDWVSVGVGVVTYLLGTFSDFLGVAAAPPFHPLHDASTRLTVGMASFGSLIAFLVIVAVVRAFVNIPRVVPLILCLICAVGFVVAGARYKRDRERLSFDYVGEDYSGGYRLTPFADSLVRQDPTITKTSLIQNAGGVRQAATIWPADSIDAAHDHLSLLYIVFVVAALSSVFWLTQGLLSE